MVHAMTKAKPKAKPNAHDSSDGQLEDPKPGRTPLRPWLCATSPNLIVVTVMASGNLVSVIVVSPEALVVRPVLI